MNKASKKALSAAQEYEGRLLAESVRGKPEPELSFNSDDIIDKKETLRTACPSAQFYRIAAVVLVIVFAVFVPFSIKLYSDSGWNLSSLRYVVYEPVNYPTGYYYANLTVSKDCVKISFSDGENNIYLIQSTERKPTDGMSEMTYDGKKIYVDKSPYETCVYFDAFGRQFCVSGNVDISVLLHFTDIKEKTVAR